MRLNKKKLLTLLLSVEKKNNKQKLLRSNLKCLIGISGGQDSVCLGLFLRSLKKKNRLGFDFVYCHHAWQQESFYHVVQIFKYAVYSEGGCFVFLNSKVYK